MKIGILSFQNAVNYGAALQLYALQTSLENYGYDVEIIDYICKSVEKMNKIDRQPFVAKNTNLRLLKKIYLKFDYYRTRNIWDKRYYSFKNFRENYLKLSNQRFYSIKDLNNINRYDAIIVGSDQVWNPNITDGLDPVFFCAFELPDEVKKIAYSASCGSVNTLKNNYDIFYELINNFDHISTREEELNKFVNLKKKSTRTLDPTFLLNLNEYNKIVKSLDIDNYLLIYKMQKNDDLYKLAKKISKEKQLKIVDISFPPPLKKDKEIIYLPYISPQEFLGLFRKASYVITNSFHGTAFSIIFEREFFTFPHRSVGQRMVDLLNLLKLKERLVTDLDKIYSIDIAPINYKIVNEILKIEIKKSLSYLNNALS